MVTQNKNFLSPNGFQLVINRDKYPNLEYFCVAASLPSISLTEATMPFRRVGLAEVGDRIEFGDFTVTINVTEDMENYEELFNWVVRCTTSATNQKEEAELLILNSHNNVVKKIHFTDVFPLSIDGIDFNTQNTEVPYVQISVNFAYSTFEFK